MKRRIFVLPSIKRRIFALSLLAALLIAGPAYLTSGHSTSWRAAQGPVAAQDSTVPVLVKVKSSASSAAIANAIRAAGGYEVRDLKQVHTYVVDVPASRRNQVLAALVRQPAVER